MNPTDLNASRSNLRASDADRDAVLAELSEHFMAGRLTSPELDERTNRALAAKTYGDLQGLMQDLPAIRTAAAAQPPEPAPPAPTRHPAPPIVAALAGVAVIALVLGLVSGHHAWQIWWVIPIALIVVRRVTCRTSTAHNARND
jgi:hypothetical protein